MPKLKLGERYRLRYKRSQATEELEGIIIRLPTDGRSNSVHLWLSDGSGYRPLVMSYITKAKRLRRY